MKRKEEKKEKKMPPKKDGKDGMKEPMGKKGCCK